MPRPRSRLRAVLGFAAGALLGALVVDGGLRLIEATPLWRLLPVVEPILAQPDWNFGFAPTPGAHGIWPIENRAQVALNSLGLRDVERAPHKPTGAFRVGLLGDSMVEALTVDQAATFNAIAERRLVADGHRVELINLAVSGPNPLRQLWRLQQRGYSLGLDLVVANTSMHAFVLGSLFDDSRNPSYVDAGNGELAVGYGFRRQFSQRHADTWYGRLSVALFQSSPVLRIAYFRAKQTLPVLLGLASAFPPPSGAAPPTHERACAEAVAALGPMLELWREHRPPLLWAAATRFLDDFATSTREHRVPVLFVMRDIPLAPPDCPAAAAARADLVALVGQAITSRGMRFVDWSALVGEAVGGPAGMWSLNGFGLRKGGGHLNYDGHRAWAIALLAALAPELPGRAEGRK